MAANARIRITATDNTGRAVSQASRNMDRLKDAAAGVAAAVGASMGALAAYSANQSRVISENKKFAEQLGITTQSLSELAYAFGQEGNVNAEQFSDMLQELNLRLGEAAVTGGGALVDAFKQLGLSVEEVRDLRTDEMVLKIADAFEQLEDKQRSQFLADETFAGEGAKLITLLNRGSGAVRELTREYRELNGVITEEEADKIAGLSESWGRMEIALDGVAKVILKATASDVGQWIDNITEALSKFSSWMDQNKDIIQFITGMTPLTGFRTYREGLSALRNELTGTPDTLEEVEASIRFLENSLINGTVHAEKFDKALSDLQALYAQRSEMETVVKITYDDGGDQKDEQKKKPLFFETPEGAKSIQDALFQAEVEGAQMRVDALNDIWNSYQYENKIRAEEWRATWEGVTDSFSAGIGDAFASAIVDQTSLGDALQAVMRQTAKQVISTLIQIGIQRAIQAATSKGELAAITGAGVASAGTLAAAYGPAALAANIASFGGAALAAAASAPIAASAQIAAMSSTKLSGIAHDGLDYVPRTGTYLLEKGERVIKKEDNKPGAMGGNTYNFTIQAIDTQTGVDFLMQNEGAIIEMVQQRYESRGEKGGPIA